MHASIDHYNSKKMLRIHTAWPPTQFQFVCIKCWGEIIKINPFTFKSHAPTRIQIMWANCSKIFVKCSVREMDYKINTTGYRGYARSNSRDSQGSDITDLRKSSLVIGACPSPGLPTVKLSYSPHICSTTTHAQMKLSISICGRRG